MKKVKTVYSILKDFKKKNSFGFSDKQLHILDTERELHLAGVSKSYNRNEASEIIKGKRLF